MRDIGEQRASLGAAAFNEAEATEVLASFDAVWQALTSHEQGKLLRLLVQRIDYDGGQGKVAIVFHQTGIGELTAQCRRLAVEAN